MEEKITLITVHKDFCNKARKSLQAEGFTIQSSVISGINKDYVLIPVVYTDCQIANLFKAGITFRVLLSNQNDDSE